MKKKKREISSLPKPKNSKWEICPDCKLHIRANGKTPEERLEAHQKGYHHKVKTGGSKRVW